MNYFKRYISLFMCFDIFRGGGKPAAGAGTERIVLIEGVHKVLSRRSMPLSCSILGCIYFQFVVCTTESSLFTIYYIMVYSSTICVGWSSSSLKLLVLEADRLFAAAADSSFPDR